MAMTTKDHTPIEIKVPLPRISIDFALDELGKEQRVPFFRALSQMRENTWIISLFVILHLVAFAATMIVNDCWKNSHCDCALKPLGQLSFQPLSENPLLDPSSSALDTKGANQQTKREDHVFLRKSICRQLTPNVKSMNSHSRNTIFPLRFNNCNKISSEDKRRIIIIIIIIIRTQNTKVMYPNNA
ncbi:hypothetical protein CsSME_00042940 [Camellia sinensis var. sinensis]